MKSRCLVLLMTFMLHFSKMVAAQAPAPLDHGEIGFGPPSTNGSVEVRPSLRLESIDSIDSENGVCEFTGTLSLQWRDARRSFDAESAGVRTKTFQGEYQIFELSPGWFPQVYLVNDAGSYERRACTLAVQADGTCHLSQVIHAAAKARFDLRKLPFDTQQIQLRFASLDPPEETMQFVNEEVVRKDPLTDYEVPQWTVRSLASRIDSTKRLTSESTDFVVELAIDRQPFFLLRMVILPLLICTLLTMSVFWMEPSMLGDRMNVSFVGILTSVAYLIVISDVIPQIAYITLTHAFLSFSLIVMAATAVTNIVIGWRDRHGKSCSHIDATCRWLFPSAYALLILMAVVVVYTE